MELGSANTGYELKVMTWNIFSDWCGDQALFKRFTPHADSPGCCDAPAKRQKFNEQLGSARAQTTLSWNHRLRLIVEEVRKHDRHVICFQEMSQAQFTGINIELAKLGYTGIHVSDPPWFEAEPQAKRQMTNGTKT